MIEAKEARARIDKKLDKVFESEGFKNIMADIEKSIIAAVERGEESCELITYLLPQMAKHKLPEGCHPEDTDVFWFKYVFKELQRLGYRIANTMTSEHYRICW